MMQLLYSNDDIAYSFFLFSNAALLLISLFYTNTESCRSFTCGLSWDNLRATVNPPNTGPSTTPSTKLLFEGGAILKRYRTAIGNELV